MKTLDKLALGQSAQISKIETSGPNAQRLMAMGVLPGSKVKLVQIAPLGDPITILLAGGKLSLRKSDACFVHLSE
ncbi:FeoA family protein [Kamptonema cortianum]|nr:FeoA family protein [Kamptonema cortianum]MDL5044500.1 FeoA family protein [Oscillatoria amoena NRMC-F 0135]